MVDSNYSPTFSQFLLMKLASRRSNKEKQGNTRGRTLIQAIIRLVLHLCGFGCLTFAGFTWNITAGLVVGGVSFFVMSWLVSGNEEPNLPVGYVRAPDMRTGR